MRVEVLNKDGENTGRSLTLPENIFGVEPNEHVMYLAAKQFLAAQRQGTHKSKEKWEVARTTKKFKRQKGTGGARAGSLKSPLWRGGGRVFGPQPRSYDISLNKKVKKLARYSALSKRFKEGQILVVEDFNFDKPSTKSFNKVLNSLGVDRYKTLFVLSNYNKIMYLSSRNIPSTSVVNVTDLNTFDILNAQRIVFLESSISKVL